VANPLLVAVLLLLVVAGIAGMVIVLLLPAREKILNDEPAENDARISSQWAGGDDTPTHSLPSHHDNVVHHDFGGHAGGHGGGPF
jgi:hypothetical protein